MRSEMLDQDFNLASTRRDLEAQAAGATGDSSLQGMFSVAHDRTYTEPRKELPVFYFAKSQTLLDREVLLLAAFL